MKEPIDPQAGEVRRSLRNGQYVTHIPLRFRKRGSRKVLIPPPGTAPVDAPAHPEPPLLLALGRAFYWQSLLEEGEYEDADALARGVEQERTVVKQTLRLVLLAPDIVGAILEGRQPRTMTIRTVRRFIPASWDEQRRLWGFVSEVM